MGLLIDEYKSQKNRELLTMASFKMLKDKFKIEITEENGNLYQTIIKSAISTVSNDAILINTKISLQELNNITLVKVKEQIDLIGLRNKHEEKHEHEQARAQELNQKSIDDSDNKKVSDEELVAKVRELEEKRKISNLLLQTEGYKIIEDSIYSDSQQNQFQNNVNSMNAYFNPTIISDVIQQINDVKRTSISSKVVIINSQSRDWVNKQPNRNGLKFSINIDFTQYTFEAYKIIFPKFVKDTTPYITMYMNDGFKVQKIYYIYSKSNGSIWDEWIVCNSSHIELVYLENKTWNITFYNHMNKELDLGNDNINITEVLKLDKNKFQVKISDPSDPSDLLDLDTMNTWLLYTNNNNMINVNLYSLNGEIILKVTEADKELDIEHFINSKLLNLKAQYSLIFMQCKK